MRCSRGSWRFAVVSLSVAAVLVPSGWAPARADEPKPGAAAPGPEDQAVALVREGNTAYRAGHYQQALELYERAHKLSPMASTLFNMAQCQRKLKRPVEALALYERYLAAEPNASNRATVERFMAELRVLAAGARPAEKPAEKPADRPATETAPSSPPPPVHVQVPVPVHEQRPAARPAPPRVLPAALPVTSTADVHVAQRASAAPSRPLYRRWYFWVGLGVAVAGGAVAGALLGTRGGEVPELGPPRPYFQP